MLQKHPHKSAKTRKKKSPPDYEDITGKPPPLREDIRSAHAGDRTAARRLLETFCRTVEDGRRPPPEMLNYFAQCFRATLEGKEPAAALHLRGKGRPVDRALWLRDAKLAVAVEALQQQGKTLERALAAVAEAQHVSESVAKRAYLSLLEPYRSLKTSPRRVR